jgi:hypothetical protein
VHADLGLDVLDRARLATAALGVREVAAPELGDVEALGLRSFGGEFVGEGAQRGLSVTLGRVVDAPESALATAAVDADVSVPRQGAG